MIKKTFYLYQRAMWYLNIAVGEVRKPLILWNETALLTIFLSSVLGYKVPFLWILIVYILISVVGVGIGKLLVYWGIVAFNSKLGNQQSPELMSIHDKVNVLYKKYGNTADLNKRP